MTKRMENDILKLRAGQSIPASHKKIIELQKYLTKEEYRGMEFIRGRIVLIKK